MSVRASVLVVLVCLFIAPGAAPAQDENPLSESPQIEDTLADDVPDQQALSQETGQENLRQETIQELEAAEGPVQETMAEEAPAGEPEVQREQAQEATSPGEAIQEPEAAEEPVQKTEAEEAPAPEDKSPKGELQKGAVPGGDAQKRDLQERIEELEKRINELTEESRARRKLEITEQEKQEKEKDVLEAVGREYTLDQKHSLGIDYSLSYSYSPSERFDSALIVTEESDHTITHTISATYGILDNLSASSSLPFVYRYNKLGTEEEIDETDIGDISLGISFQPWTLKGDDVNKTLSLSVTLPTGRSPYKINPETELSTGSGIFSIAAGGSFSKQIDPVVAFWNFSYSYNMDVDSIDQNVAEGYVLEKVDPGNSFSAGAGLAYALSYKVSVNASFGYSYTYSSSYYYRYATNSVKSGDSVSATIGLGVGWKLNNKTTLSLGIGYGLTATGFSMTLRVPFNFML